MPRASPRPRLRVCSPGSIDTQYAYSVCILQEPAGECFGFQVVPEALSLSHRRHLGWPWRDDPPTAATRGLRRIRCVATMNVELVAPDRKIWSGEAEMVIARTTDGDIGILPGHEPTLGVLVESPVRIKRTGED